MVLWKQVKPSKMRIDAFRLEFLSALKKAGREVVKDFEKTVATWNKKPAFLVAVSLTGPGPILEVYTEDEIYKYVSRGTKPHLIWAGYYTGKSDHKVLAFPSSSTPKTRPGFIGSGAGSRSKSTTYRPYVQHKGIKARKFEEAIAKGRMSWFKKEMEAAMRRAAQKSGHATT